MIKASLARLHAALLAAGAPTSEADDFIAYALEAGADDEEIMSATRSIMRVVEAPVITLDAPWPDVGRGRHENRPMNWHPTSPKPTRTKSKKAKRK